MRWVSNRESVRTGEPSILAVGETLAAMAISLWIAVHFGTVKHVIIGACIAPLLLLRTDESSALGIRVLARSTEWVARLPQWIQWATSPVFLLVFVPIRVFATVVALVRSPASLARAIPWNWRRIAIATDSSRSPQILPTPDDPAQEEKTPYVGSRLDVYEMIAGWRVPYIARSVSWKSAPSWISLTMAWCFKWLLFLPLVASPAILYRLSLKSTAIIWFPLLWALRAVAPSDQPLKARLRLFEKSDLLRWVVLPISVAAIGAFALKLAFWNELTQVATTWNESMAGRILTIHVAPGVIELWQLATFLNSLIALGLWFFARSCLRHIDEGLPRAEGLVERVLGWTLFLRRIFTTYTILCVGYFYAREAMTWNLPAFGGKLLPWM